MNGGMFLGAPAAVVVLVLLTQTLAPLAPWPTFLLEAAAMCGLLLTIFAGIGVFVWWTPQ